MARGDKKYVLMREDIGGEVNPAAIGAVRKTGDTMSGALNIALLGNGWGTLTKNHSADLDYGTELTDRDKDGNFVTLKVQANDNKIAFYDTNRVKHTIFHDGNKPCDGYTGNGSTSRDPINTDGSGTFAIIQSGTGIAVLTAPGGVGFKFGDGQVYYLGAYFSGGKIIINTDHELVNKNGSTYKYQVI